MQIELNDRQALYAERALRRYKNEKLAHAKKFRADYPETPACYPDALDEEATFAVAVHELMLSALEPKFSAIRHPSTEEILALRAG